MTLMTKTGVQLHSWIKDFQTDGASILGFYVTPLTSRVFLSFSFNPLL